MKSFLVKNPFYLAILAYILSIFIIRPFGEFAVNDDWIFVRQVESFLKGYYTISSILDPSFIAQGLLGLGWSLLFGFSFESLRVLTITISVILFLGVLYILRYLKCDPKVSLIALLALIFNPLLFHLSMSFMTEVYFLTFLCFSCLFYIKALRNDSILKNIILGSLFCGFCILVRQIGILVFVSFFIAYLITNIKSYKKSLSYLLIGSITIIVSVILIQVWPKYFLSGIDALNGVSSLRQQIIDPLDLSNRIKMLLLSLWYFAFFLLPLSVFIKVPLSKVQKQVFWLCVFILAIIVFKFDLFPVGNVLYLEGLYSKTNYKPNLTILNFIPVKAFVAFLISFSCVHLTAILFKLFNRNFFLNGINIFLSILGLLMFLVLIVNNDFYDRYLLTSFICFLLLFTINIKDMGLNINKYRILISLMFVFMSIILQKEFIDLNKAQWKIANQLILSGKGMGDIYINDTYRKYSEAVLLNDYTGTKDMQINQRNCFIQRYNTDLPLPVFKTFEFIDSIFAKILGRPSVYENKKIYSPPDIKKRLDELLYNESYFSFAYYFVGKTSNVGAWCGKQRL